MNKILILFLAFLFTCHAYGQYRSGFSSIIPYEKGYIYLKDGSVIKGKYIYSNSMEKIRVISGKSSWIFDAGEVEKVSGMKPERKFSDDADFSAPDLPESDWLYITEIGVLVGNDENSQPRPMVVGTSFNYRVYHNLSAGAGIGVEFLKETYMPVTLNLMYKFRNTRVTPFAMLQSGYQIPVEDSRTVYSKVVPLYAYSISDSYIGPWPNSQSEMKAKGGFLVNPSIGLLKQSSSGAGMSLAFGYRFHRLRYTAEEDYRLDIDFNRLSVKLGIIFN